MQGAVFAYRLLVGTAECFSWLAVRGGLQAPKELHSRLASPRAPQYSGSAPGNLKLPSQDVKRPWPPSSFGGILRG